MPGPTSSASPGTPYTRPGSIMVGGPTFFGASASFATLASSASMQVFATPFVINTLSVTVSMLASQPWTKWADHLHAKAFQ